MIILLRKETRVCDEEECHEKKEESFLDHQNEHIECDLKDDPIREHGEDHVEDDTLASEVEASSTLFMDEFHGNQRL